MSHRLAALALGAAIAAAALPAIGAARRRPPSLDQARVVDLSHPFDEKTLYWPTAPSGFKLTTLHHGVTPAGFFYAANSFCAPEHGGTHLDAPSHFAKDGFTADRIPLSSLVAPGVVVDVSKSAAADADYRLSAADVARRVTSGTEERS